MSAESSSPSVRASVRSRSLPKCSRASIWAVAAIVTGGYSGIGLETVRALAGAGAEVTVPARRVDVAEAALAGIEGVSVAAMDPPTSPAYAPSPRPGARAIARSTC